MEGIQAMLGNCSVKPLFWTSSSRRKQPPGKRRCCQPPTTVETWAPKSRGNIMLRPCRATPCIARILCMHCSSDTGKYTVSGRRRNRYLVRFTAKFRLWSPNNKKSKSKSKRVWRTPSGWNLCETQTGCQRHLFCVIPQPMGLRSHNVNMWPGGNIVRLSQHTTDKKVVLLWCGIIVSSHEQYPSRYRLCLCPRETKHVYRCSRRGGAKPTPDHLRDNKGNDVPKPFQATNREILCSWITRR